MAGRRVLSPAAAGDRLMTAVAEPRRRSRLAERQRVIYRRQGFRYRRERVNYDRFSPICPLITPSLMSRFWTSLLRQC